MFYQHLSRVQRFSSLLNNSILRCCDSKILPKCSIDFRITRQFSHNLPLCTFKGEKDRFNGLTIDLSKEQFKPSEFISILKESLNKWHTDNNRCIWFKVNIQDACHIPVLAENGFNFHHARDSYVMMYKWLPSDSEPNLPPPCHTNLGVGAMVFNSRGQLLAISEKNYDYPHWKLPGGYVEKGEDIIEAARREVQEETGIDTEFKSLVTFRHTHNMMYGNSDIYVLVRMKALTENIQIAQREVNNCQWMDVEEYTNHPHVHEWNRLVIKRALDYKNRGIKIHLQKKTVKWAQNVREMSVMMIEDADD